MRRNQGCFFSLLAHILDPGLHARVLLFQHPLILVTLIEGPGNDHRSISPASRPRKGFPWIGECSCDPGNAYSFSWPGELGAGNDISDLSIRHLLGRQILQPFAQEARSLHEEGAGARKDLDIARPAGSFPGGTVGGNLKHVAFLTPQNVLLEPVDQRIGALEGSCLWQI